MLNMVAKLRKSASFALCALAFGGFLSADPNQPVSTEARSSAVVKSPGPEAHD